VKAAKEEDLFGAKERVVEEQQKEREAAVTASYASRAFVVYWYSFSNSCTVVRSLGLCLV